MECQAEGTACAKALRQVQDAGKRPVWVEQRQGWESGDQTPGSAQRVLSSSSGPGPGLDPQGMGVDSKKERH